MLGLVVITLSVFGLHLATLRSFMAMLHQELKVRSLQLGDFLFGPAAIFLVMIYSIGGFVAILHTLYFVQQADLFLRWALILPFIQMIYFAYALSAESFKGLGEFADKLKRIWWAWPIYVLGVEISFRIFGFQHIDSWLGWIGSLMTAMSQCIPFGLCWYVENRINGAFS